MSAMVAAGRRHLPGGWADLGRQLAIWFGFAVIYQVVRGGASDQELVAAVRTVWAGRADRYSDLRSAATAELDKVEMSYIGG